MREHGCLEPADDSRRQPCRSLDPWPVRSLWPDVARLQVLSGGAAFATTLVGTPAYLSPEVCEGRPYDARSDVWALGVVAYECVARRPPFDAANQVRRGRS